MLKYSKIISILEKKKVENIIRELKNLTAFIEDRTLKTQIGVYVSIYEHPQEEREKHINQSVPISFKCSDWWLYSLDSRRSGILIYCRKMINSGKIYIKDYTGGTELIKHEPIDLSYLEEEYDE